MVLLNDLAFFDEFAAQPMKDYQPMHIQPPFGSDCEDEEDAPLTGMLSASQNSNSYGPSVRLPAAVPPISRSASLRKAQPSLRLQNEARETPAQASLRADDSDAEGGESNRVELTVSNFKSDHRRRKSKRRKRCLLHPNASSNHYFSRQADGEECDSDLR